MLMLAPKPDKTYRQIGLDARIEASRGGDLTVICLEEAVAALSQAVFMLDRDPARVPHEPLSRAHEIAIWLGRSVAPDNPLRGPMVQFYSALANAVGANRTAPSRTQLVQVHSDFSDLLEACQTASKAA